MIRIPLLPTGDRPIFNMSTKTTETGPASSTDNLTTARGSASPTSMQQLDPAVPKRRRSSLAFWGHHSSHEGVDESGQPLARSLRRQSSLFTGFSFSTRKSSRRFEKMPVRDDDPPQQPTAQRKSSFSQLKDLLVPNKRKDSGASTSPVEPREIAPEILKNPHEHGEVTYYNSALNMPRGNSLRFQNGSPYNDDFAGPSNYFRGRPYEDRPRAVISQSIYSTKKNQWVPKCAVPALETNTEPGADDNQRSTGLSYRSPTNAARQHSTPFFQVGRSRSHKQLNGTALRSSQNEHENQNGGRIARRVSVARSIFSPRRFRASTAPYGTDPYHRLASIEELGVLPVIEEPMESEVDVPHPTFVFPTGTAGSPSSSTLAIRTRSLPDSAHASSRTVDTIAQYPPSNTNPMNSNPALIPCPPSPELSPTKTTPSVSHSTLNLPASAIDTTLSNPPLRTPSASDTADSPARFRRNRDHLAFTIRSVDEDSEDNEELELTRMDGADNAGLTRPGINGEGKSG
ncbi:hypothetical protein CC80DRAFT_533281 [Byssothecium circinans]|uniref:Uncharacterized protein n=1 Tax=Byssothecium circinans TaxID=147558 RepID=A0A6A5U2B5_9PLEO|nr:hypothetical protein CC80DRAFT_533281 [Byssothecium circinans]